MASTGRVRPPGVSMERTHATEWDAALGQGSDARCCVRASAVQPQVFQAAVTAAGGLPAALANQKRFNSVS